MTVQRLPLTPALAPPGKRESRNASFLYADLAGTVSIARRRLARGNRPTGAARPAPRRAPFAALHFTARDRPPVCTARRAGRRCDWVMSLPRGEGRGRGPGRGRGSCSLSPDGGELVSAPARQPGKALRERRARQGARAARLRP